MSTPPIRVLIADDQRLFAQALGLALDADPRLEVVGYAGDGREAVKLAVALEPDVVLMDLDMPYLTKGCSAQDVVEAVLELAAPADPRRKEVARGERGVREVRAAGLPCDLLRFRPRLAH